MAFDLSNIDWDDLKKKTGYAPPWLTSPAISRPTLGFGAGETSGIPDSMPEYGPQPDPLMNPPVAETPSSDWNKPELTTPDAVAVNDFWDVYNSGVSSGEIIESGGTANPNYGARGPISTDYTPVGYNPSAGPINIDDETPFRPAGVGTANNQTQADEIIDSKTLRDLQTLTDSLRESGGFDLNNLHAPSIIAAGGSVPDNPYANVTDDDPVNMPVEPAPDIFDGAGAPIEQVGDNDQIIVGDDDGLIVDLPSTSDPIEPVDTTDGSGNPVTPPPETNEPQGNSDSSGNPLFTPDLSGVIYDSPQPSDLPDGTHSDNDAGTNNPVVTVDQGDVDTGSDTPEPTESGNVLDTPAENNEPIGPTIPVTPTTGTPDDTNSGGDVPTPDSLLDKVTGGLGDILNTNVGGSANIGDILGGGINFYGQQQAAEAYERSAGKALDWQKQLQEKQEPFRQAGVDALPGLAGANNSDLSADPRENLNTLNPDSNVRGQMAPDKDAFGGFEGLREFDGRTGDWDYGQIERGSDEWNLTTQDAIRMAENQDKARGKLNTQQARDSAFKSFIRAQGDIENVNASRLNQEMSRRSSDFGISSAQRGQESEEQKSSSQLGFEQYNKNRDRAFQEVAFDEQTTFDNRQAENAEQMQVRNQYWQELLGGDDQEWRKFFETARLGSSASANQAAAATNAADILGAQGTVDVTAETGKWQALSSLFQSPGAPTT